jgi:putative two-component system response regulator
VNNANAPAAPRILIVEDDPSSSEQLEQSLRLAGYTEILAIAEPGLVLPGFTRHRPDLVLFGLDAPHLYRLDVLRQIQPRIPQTEFLPIAALVEDGPAGMKQRVLDAGVNDVLVKPFDDVDIVLRVRNLLQLRRVHMELHGTVRQTKVRLRRAWIEMSERLALMAEYRMSVGGSAPARIGILAAQIADHMGLSQADVRLIRHAAPLHDVGMIGLPQILANDGLLSLEELDALKTHTSVGAKMLAGSGSPILRLAEDIALFHHEHWDGSGYTLGLSGESIPLVARIVAVADTFDAMTRDRSYQAARSADEAAAWIEAQAGRKFDPTVVEAFHQARVASELPLL